MEKRNNLYVYVTWITKLIAGENSCVWSAWFKSRFKLSESDKVDSGFDLKQWSANHATLSRQRVDELKSQGFAVKEENQNSFRISGKNGAMLSGKPDIVAVKDEELLVIDCKTGTKKQSDSIQVGIYMIALALDPKYDNITKFTGEVCYTDSRLHIPQSYVDSEFKANLKDVMDRVASDENISQVPSYWECRFCGIAKSHCEARVEEKPDETTLDEHDLF